MKHFVTTALFAVGLAWPASVLAHADIEAQIASVTALIERFPDSAELYYQRAELQRNHQNWEAAFADYTECIRNQPEPKPEYYIERARTLARAGASLTGAPTGAAATNGYLTLIYVRPSPPPADIVYTPQVGCDLNNWTLNTVPVGAPVNNGDSTETVMERDTVPLSSATNRFIRLRLHSLP